MTLTNQEIINIAKQAQNVWQFENGTDCEITVQDNKIFVEDLVQKIEIEPKQFLEEWAETIVLDHTYYELNYLDTETLEKLNKA